MLEPDPFRILVTGSRTWRDGASYTADLAHKAGIPVRRFPR